MINVEKESIFDCLARLLLSLGARTAGAFVAKKITIVAIYTSVAKVCDSRDFFPIYIFPFLFEICKNCACTARFAFFIRNEKNCIFSKPSRKSILFLMHVVTQLRIYKIPLHFPYIM